MPVPPGTRFRVKQTPKGPVRLAFAGKKVIEAKKMRAKKASRPSMKNRMAEMRMKGSFGKRQNPFTTE